MGRTNAKFGGDRWHTAKGHENKGVLFLFCLVLFSVTSAAIGSVSDFACNGNSTV